MLYAIYLRVGQSPPQHGVPVRCLEGMNDTGVRPIKDQVLLRRDRATEHRNGLYLPQGSEEWDQRGTVLAIGPLVREPGIVPGARVLFRSRAGTALVPDRREPGQPVAWERVVVLHTGEAPAHTRTTGPCDPDTGAGDILGVIEEE